MKNPEHEATIVPMPGLLDVESDAHYRAQLDELVDATEKVTHAFHELRAQLGPSAWLSDALLTAITAWFMLLEFVKELWQAIVEAFEAEGWLAR